MPFRAALPAGEAPPGWSEKMEGLTAIPWHDLFSSPIPLQDFSRWLGSDPRWWAGEPPRGAQRSTGTGNGPGKDDAVSLSWIPGRAMDTYRNEAERMVRMPSKLTSVPTARLLQPPSGYRVLAWLGLIGNILSIPIIIMMILGDPDWRAAHIAVGASAAVPTAIVGVVASVALLKWRLWGQIMAIVALSMSLAVALPYSIVRLVLVAEGRPLLAVLAPLFWILNLGLLIFWCRPAIRNYLR